MEHANETVGALSKMNRELNQATLEQLKGSSDKYVDRLAALAGKTHSDGCQLGGTNVGRPIIMRFNQHGRVEKISMPPGDGLDVLTTPTPEGYLVMFPMHTVGTTSNGVPIINTDIEGSYTIAHLPGGIKTGKGYSPAFMETDLVFTVDADNLVTVNGQNPVTALEYELFDAIVVEFEQRASGTPS